MSDIVTKLRSGEHGWLHELSEQAADEIDRLRAEIASLIAANGDLQRWFDAAFSEFGRKDAEIARLREALGELIGFAETNHCTHDDTYRGGAIWEICNDCGAMWADDTGGKPKYREPKEFTKARAALAQVAENQS